MHLCISESRCVVLNVYLRDGKVCVCVCCSHCALGLPRATSHPRRAREVRKEGIKSERVLQMVLGATCLFKPEQWRASKHTSSILTRFWQKFSFSLFSQWTKCVVRSCRFCA